MIPLGIASIIALAISFERFVSLRKKRVVPDDFITGLKSAYDQDPVKLILTHLGKWFAAGMPDGVSKMFGSGV